MHRNTSMIIKALAAATMAISFGAQAQVIRIDQSAFTAAAGLITFSEFPGGTVNPTYTAADYGGGASAPTVTFGGFYTGQALGTPATCPAGAALTGCVVGSPTGGTLTLDPNSPATFIASDGANPTSPVLSGNPIFNGPVSIIFSTDQYGVGLDGGYFDSPHSTAITAFDRAGNVIGQVSNNGTGIEFLGLVTADGNAEIAGLQFSLVGDEPFGFAIDNLQFGTVSQVMLPEPETYAMMIAGLGLLAVAARRRRRNNG